MFSRNVSSNGCQVIRLEFTSGVEMLDLVQVVADYVGRECGFDEDAIHWVGVAIRESVINAIRHGNRNDTAKHVFVDFERAGGEAPGLLVCVRDRGAGSTPNRWPIRSIRRISEVGWPRRVSHPKFHGRRAAQARARRG